MKLSFIVVGFALIGLALWLLLPSILLSIAGSPITSEVALFQFAGNSIAENIDTPEAKEVMENTTKSIGLFNIIPYALIGIGFFLIVIGFIID